MKNVSGTGLSVIVCVSVCVWWGLPVILRRCTHANYLLNRIRQNEVDVDSHPVMLEFSVVFPSLATAVPPNTTWLFVHGLIHLFN